MVFSKGDEVEVCSKEEGFLGSYFEATVVLPLNDNTLYKVQYKNLVEEEDQTRPLVEIVSADEVQPVPPRTVGEATRFSNIMKVLMLSTMMVGGLGILLGNKG